MKIPVPIRVYADFECVNQPTNKNNPNEKILFKQLPIAVGYYLVTPTANQF